MTEVEKAEAALRAAKANEKESKLKNKVALNRFCVGRCFKYTKTFNYSIDINYVKVIDHVRYKDGKLMYGEGNAYLAAEYVNVGYATPNYFLDGGELKYKDARSRVHLPIKKHYDKHAAINPNSINAFTYFQPERFANDGSKRVYADNECWTECTLDEFNEVRQKVIDMSVRTKAQFKQYHSKNPYEVKDTKLEVVDVKLLTDLLKKVDTGDIKLDKLVNLARKKADFIPFNSSYQLDELGQYYISEDKGLNLKIEGGDDGTDYEPYITKYELSYVDIDWKTILYPIRTKLDSVIETARDLENLGTVYNTDSWSVSYSGTYDVNFDSCILCKSELNRVNEVIAKHLK